MNNSNDYGNSSYHFKPMQWPIDLEEAFFEIAEFSIEMPCLITENVTFDQFATLRDHDFFHNIEFVEGQVFAVEMSCRIHEVWPSKLVLDLAVRYPYLVSLRRSNVYYTKDRWAEPDQSFCLDDIETNDGSLNDFAGDLAPVLVIESIVRVSLAETIKKFKEKYFKVNGCRVGLIMDFNTIKKNVSLYKVTRSQENPIELQVTKSTDGKITILNTEIYPPHYRYEDVSRQDLPNIEIDLKSPVFDRIYKSTYNEYTVDEVERKMSISKYRDTSYHRD